MLVKICGLCTVEHALAAAAAGADLLGLVFAPSRRRITVDAAAAIVSAVRAVHGPRPLIAGLFVNTAPPTISTVAARVGLDLVQLSGDEPASDADQIELPILKSIRMNGSTRETTWLARVNQQQVGSALPVAAPPAALILLVDAHVPGSYGGTGVTADWQRAATLAAEAPLMLAGGLTPENVAAAIAAVHPLGVDVSSGVETAGVKDAARIEAFVQAVRATQA